MTNEKKTLNDSMQDYLLIKSGCIYYVAKPTPVSNELIKECPYPPRFYNFVEKNLPTCNNEQFSTPMDISNLRVFTFLLINNGNNPVKCQVEMSPDGVIWDSFDEIEYHIPRGARQVIVPQYFLRFTRLKYKNWNQGFNSYITIWFQGQS